jgi:AraC-like DNA-binding protein
MNYRIERAARKLDGSDASITQIAFDCGFNDLSYFIKTFKEIKGVSPSKYRKKFGVG